MTERKALGRGLDALFGESKVDLAIKGESGASGDGQQKQLPIGDLQPSNAQPRRFFDSESIDQLAVSIREHGILQPILVRPTKDQPVPYEIIAGERRWRAAAKAQIHDVPVIIEELTDLEALEIALVENLQRQDLTAIEEAEGYQRLMKEFGHTQEKLAAVIGKSRPAIANALRLLNLPEKVRTYVHEGKLSAGHARTLLKAEDPLALAETVIKNQMNVRDLEKIMREKSGKKPKKQKSTTTAKDANIISLERDLTNQLGLKVQINHQKDGSGTFTLNYQNLDQLDEILHQLTHGQKR